MANHYLMSNNCTLQVSFVCWVKDYSPKISPEIYQKSYEN